MQTKPTSTVRVRILVYTQASAYLLLLPQIWRGRKEEDMILFSCPITLKMRIILNLPRTPWLKKYHGFLINLGRSFFYSWVGRIMFIQIDEVFPIGNVEKQQQKMNLWRSLILKFVLILMRVENRTKSWNCALEVEIQPSIKKRRAYYLFLLNCTGICQRCVHLRKPKS